MNRFRILRGNVGGIIDRDSTILTACAGLQNYIIQTNCPFETEVRYDSPKDETEVLGIHLNSDAPLGMSYCQLCPMKSLRHI